MQAQRGLVRGVQVVIHDPARRRPGLVAGALRQLQREGAEQVVAGVAAVRDLRDQVRVEQGGEQFLHPRLVDARQAGRRRRGEVGPGVDGEQPEQAGHVTGQHVVGAGQDEPQAGGRVAGGQPAQVAATPPQVRSQGVERQDGAGDRPSRGDGQGQGQARARVDDLVGGGGGRLDPAPAEAVGEQVA